MGISDIEHVILVLSGKGGVGKSSVAVHLSLTLKDMGYKVGLLDTDLCGPSIPHLLNIEDHDVHQCAEGWMPIFVDKEQTICVMSIGFLLSNRNDAVIWRGPKKNAMIKQFLSDVNWPKLDYLVVDMPPGTTDEHITMIESVKNHKHVGAILVTTPQLVSINDVRREITFCKKTSIDILGVIENMSGFVCPNCQECTAVFSEGGGKLLANESNVPFLGSVPLDPDFASSIAKRCNSEKIDSETLKKFELIAQSIINKINEK